MAGESRMRWELIAIVAICLPLIGGGILFFGQFTNTNHSSHRMTPDIKIDKSLVQQAGKSSRYYNKSSLPPVQMDGIPEQYETLGRVENYTVALDEGSGDMLIYDNSSGLGVNTTSVEGQQIIRDLMNVDKSKMDGEAREWFKTTADRMVKFATGQAQPNELNQLARMKNQMPKSFQETMQGAVLDSIFTDPRVFPANFPQSLPQWATLPSGFDSGLTASSNTTTSTNTDSTGFYLPTLSLAGGSSGGNNDYLIMPSQSGGSIGLTTNTGSGNNTNTSGGYYINPNISTGTSGSNTLINSSNVIYSSPTLSTNTLSTNTLNTNTLNTNTLSTNTLNTNTLNTNTLSTNTLSTNTLSTNTLNINTLNTNTLSTNTLSTNTLSTSPSLSTSTLSTTTDPYIDPTLSTNTMPTSTLSTTTDTQTAEGPKTVDSYFCKMLGQCSQ